MFTEYRFDDPVVTEAFINLELAKNLFNQADTPAIIDAAIYDLTAAEFQLRAVLKRARDKQADPIITPVDSSRRFIAGKPNPPPTQPLFRLRP